MRHWNKYILALSLGLGSLALHAQSSFSSLQQVWAYADEHNIQLRAAAGNTAAAAIGVKQAYGQVLPTVNMNGNFTDNLTIQPTLIPAGLFNPAAPAGTFSEVTFGRRYVYSGIVAAQFDLLNTQDWFAIKAAKLNREIAGLTMAQTKKDLYEQLSNAWFSCLLLMEAEQLSKDNVANATTMYTLSQNKFKEGTISEVTVNTALINKEKAEKSLALSIQNKAVQVNNLRLLLNLQNSVVIAPAPLQTGAITDTASFTEDPAVAMAYTQMLAAKNEWQQSKAAFAPTLSAVYQYSSQTTGDDFLKFNNSSSLPQQYWGLRLSVPVFTGNTRHYQVQKNKINYTTSQQQYNNAQLQTAINNENLLLTWKSAASAFEKARSILALYQSNDAHANRRMQEGVISMEDRLKVYADLISNQNEYLQSMSDYFIQEYHLLIRQTNFK